MKKYVKADWLAWLLTGLGFLFAAGVVCFLPGQIPMQWDGLHVNWYAHKIAIFALPCLMLAFTLLKPYFQILKNPQAAPMLPSLIMNCTLVIFLTLEFYTAAFCFGLRIAVSDIVIPEVCIAVALCLGYTLFCWRKYRCVSDH